MQCHGDKLCFHLASLRENIEVDWIRGQENRISVGNDILPLLASGVHCSTELSLIRHLLLHIRPDINVTHIDSSLFINLFTLAF